jgi:hypothetical protein
MPTTTMTGISIIGSVLVTIGSMVTMSSIIMPPLPMPVATVLVAVLIVMAISIMSVAAASMIDRRTVLRDRSPGPKHSSMVAAALPTVAISVMNRHRLDDGDSHHWWVGPSAPPVGTSSVGVGGGLKRKQPES